MAKDKEPKPLSEIDTLAKIGRELDRLETEKGTDAMERTLNWILSRYAPDGYVFNKHRIES